MSDNLKTVQVKTRGDFGSGKTEFLTLVERLAKRFGMQTRMDADGHNLSITSTKEERERLFAFNREEETACK
jgi:hypothetical protein